jgi:hypothetical protein
MARVKKSRKVGKIGVTKSETPKKAKKPQLSKSTNTAGNKAGTRQQVALNSGSNKGSKEIQDPRIGSKKAIDLNKYLHKSPAVATKSRYISPQQELDAIEQDPRLEQLLEKQEIKKLTLGEKEYVDKSLNRHKQLCKMLGIDMEEDESEQNTDPFAQLDAITLDDFKD